MVAGTPAPSKRKDTPALPQLNTPIRQKQDKASSLQVVEELVNKAKAEKSPYLQHYIRGQLLDQANYIDARIRKGSWDAEDGQALELMANSVGVEAVPSEEAAATLKLLPKRPIPRLKLDPPTPPGTPKQPNNLADADDWKGLPSLDEALLVPHLW